MVRETHSGSGGVTLSSIALLQERFRQLEKMKELRQEKELLRLLSDHSERSYSPPLAIHSSTYEPPRSKTCVGSELMVFVPSPPKPHCQLSLSLWPEYSSPTTKNEDSTRGANDHQVSPHLAKSSWFADHHHVPLVCTMSSKLENSGFDVDTSLRL